MTGAASVAPLNSDAQVANLLPTKNGLDNRDHLNQTHHAQNFRVQAL